MSQMTLMTSYFPYTSRGKNDSSFFNGDGNQWILYTTNEILTAKCHCAIIGSPLNVSPSE